MVLTIHCFCLSAESATVTAMGGSGASLVINPLAGSTITASHSNQASFPLVNIVNGNDDTSGGAGRIQDSSAPYDTSGYINFDPASSFTAGTIISAQDVSSSFNGNMSWTLSLDGTSVDSGPGTVNTHSWAVKTLSLGQTGSYDEARINGDMVTFSSFPDTYFGFHELLILPERMNRLDTTVSQETGTTGGGSINNIDDSSGKNWWIGSEGSSIRLTLDGTRRVSTLVLGNLQGQGDPTFNILNDQGTALAEVSMTSTASSAEFFAINFDSPITTDYLDFSFTSGTPNFREIMALEIAVPEPGSMALLIFGTASLMYFRRSFR